MFPQHAGGRSGTGRHVPAGAIAGHPTSSATPSRTSVASMLERASALSWPIVWFRGGRDNRLAGPSRGHDVQTMTVGAEADFTAFVAARQAALVRPGWALTGNRQLGEDLAQAAFDRLWPRWEQVAAEGDPWPYLQRIAVNLATTWWRRRYRHVEVLVDSVPERAAAGDLAAAELRAVVAGWLPTLPAGQRAAVVLRFMCDLPVAETAEVMRCSVGP